ncbi:MAG: hypothetical protein AAF206_14655 [Bacteroidota bacterium]
MNLRILVCTLLLFAGNAIAGVDPTPSDGARPLSLGGAFSGVNGSFWSMFHNPAGLSGLNQAQAGISLERRYLLSQLNQGSVALAMPFTDQQAVGLAVQSFGFAGFRESDIQANYAIEILDKIRFGAALHYASLQIQDYGSGSVVYADVGLQAQVNNEISVGFSAFNVNRARLQTLNGDEFIPTIVSAGIAYQPTEKVMVVADVQKDIDHPLSFRGGIEYEIVPEFTIRSGVSTEPLSLNAGFGLKLSQFKLETAFRLQEQLGFTPHLSLSFAFGQKKDADS